jgi:tRNA-(ms[2]io[6]A)-hydroxylase
MLHLHCTTDPARWLGQVDEHIDEVLIDHAHCERKAAWTALSLMNSYVEDRELSDEMQQIVFEELDHYAQVLALLDRRQIPFRRLKPGPYGRELVKLVRPAEPHRAVDRLLIAGLIEARSCERFQLLSQHVPDQELATFYASLFESEARHHTTYVRLAEHFQARPTVRERLDELAVAEANIIAIGSPLARMHS